MVVLLKKTCIRGQKGSVTLEAVIVFPVLLLITLCLILTAVVIHRKYQLLDSAIYTARERACTWDDSRKDLEKGTYREEEGDGLYWRIFNDSGGSALAWVKCGDAGNFAAATVQGGSGGHLPAVDVSYGNDIIKRTVEVEICGTVSQLPLWFSGRPENADAGVKAGVAEPVEFIRNVDLGAEYLGELKDSLKTIGSGNGSSAVPERVAASARSNVRGQKIYHYQDCRHMKKIKPENLLDFSGPEEAVGQGFKLCLDCARKRLKDQGISSTRKNQELMLQ